MLFVAIIQLSYRGDRVDSPVKLPVEKVGLEGGLIVMLGGILDVQP
jgi:hypothetical protein